MLIPHPNKELSRHSHTRTNYVLRDPLFYWWSSWYDNLDSLFVCLDSFNDLLLLLHFNDMLYENVSIKNNHD